MKYLHNCTISCFCKETDDLAAAQTLIESFLPENLEKEKIKLEEEHLRIHEGENLISLKVHTTKDRHNRVIIEHLLEKLSPEQKQTICSQNDRVDVKGALFLRFDKTLLLEKQKLELVDHGDCFHFKLLLAAYPKNKEKALLVRDALFQ
jgi:RNA binding exosome subunit